MTASAALGLDHADAVHLLRFAASFLWADARIDAPERAFLRSLARELGVESDAADVEALLGVPPEPADVDPLRVRPGLAPAVRSVALRAIAADGRVEEGELEMFDALDALLPDGPVGVGAEV